MAERTEDLNLPLSVVTRLIKEALPQGVNVSKEARVAMARAASVFVLYATATANNYALKSKRRTLAAMDVIEAMKDMEFESFVEPLKSALANYRQQQPAKSKRSAKSQQQQDDQEEDLFASPAKRAALIDDLDEGAVESGDEQAIEGEGEGEDEEGEEESGGDGEYPNDELSEQHEDDEAGEQ